MLIRSSRGLRDAALSLAASAAGGLSVSDSVRQAAEAWEQLPDALAAAGEMVLVAGAPGSGAAARARAAAGPEGAVMVVEPDPELLAAVRAEAADAAGLAPLTAAPAALTDWRAGPQAVEQALAGVEVTDAASYLRFQRRLEEACLAAPLVAEAAADVVVLDLTMNRVRPRDAPRVLREAARVVRLDGRVVAAAVLADEPPPASADLGEPLLLHVPTEAEFLAALEAIGVDGLRIAWRAPVPARVVEGVELRLHVAVAWPRPSERHLDRGHALVYRGPWGEVVAEDGSRFVRGERAAVSEAAFTRYGREPFAGQFLPIPPYTPVAADVAPPMDQDSPRVRHPQVTKGTRDVFGERTGGPASGCCEP